MQMGFNNEFDYRELRFHIQTEDRGLQAAKIESHIFNAGNILDTNIISYEKLLAADLSEKDRETKIQAMMKANHRLLYQRLIQGEYDKLVGLAPDSNAEEIDAAEDFNPTPDVIEGAIEVEKAGEVGGATQPLAAPPALPTQKHKHERHLVEYSDSGILAFRGLVHKEKNLDVTELVLKLVS